MGKHSHKEKHKKHKKEKKKHKKRDRKRQTSSSSSEDEWVEKETSSLNTKQEIVEDKEPSRPQDDWDLFSSIIPSTSRPDRKTERDEIKRKEREANQYDPSKCTRELNPYWKDGGDGLPSAKFLKPSDGKDSHRDYKRHSTNNTSSSSNWRKKRSSEDSSSSWKKQSRAEDEYSTRKEDLPNEFKTSSTSGAMKKECNENSPTTSKNTSASNVLLTDEEILSDKQLNELAAKLIKAEILGNTELAIKLKSKLENARSAKKQEVHNKEQEEVILTRTDSKGFSKPLTSSYSESDKYGGRKSKKQKVETHDSGSRVRYFPDDDKYSLQQMFENEKFNTTKDQEAEFIKLAAKISKNDDMDDSYTDKIRIKESSEKLNKRAKDAAIDEHRKTTKSLDKCSLCLQSQKMSKHLMIALGQTCYLTLPIHEPLTTGHCIIVPNRHVPCGTQLDENEWEEIMNFRKSLTRMFSEQDGDDVIFFEVATGLNHFPHMYLECVPVPKEEGDMAPIYFKKAIDECEMEWATNKKLVSLAGRDVRRAIPKGLSYFCVSFGMQEGYAHVIEDQQMFPSNFAQEIIGGMLDLHHSKWRKPKREHFDEQKERVLQFSKMWRNYDCTNKDL